MHSIELKVINDRDDFLNKLINGEDEINIDEINEIIYGGDTYAYYDYDELRFRIFKVALEKGYCHHEDFDFYELLIQSGNSYMRKYSIEAILEENSLALKPENLKEQLMEWGHNEEYAEELSIYWDEYKLEISSLEKITFGNNTLLNLFSTKDIDELATMSRNQKVKDIITNPDFLIRYPLMGNKIKQNFEKGLARNKALNTALNSVYYNNTNIKLFPPECWKKILGNLDIQDLKNVTNVASLFFKSTSAASNTPGVAETCNPSSSMAFSHFSVSSSNNDVTRDKRFTHSNEPHVLYTVRSTCFPIDDKVLLDYGFSKGQWARNEKGINHFLTIYDSVESAQNAQSVGCNSSRLSQ